MIVVKPHCFPESDCCGPDPIGNDNFEMTLTVVNKISAKPMPCPLGVYVDRTDDYRNVFNLTAGLANALTLV